MPMTGFDPRWKDFPDYILGITKEIWEDRGLSTLHRYYAPDVIVRSPGGIVRGNEGVIAATMSQLAEFPDRQLLGEDVIWSAHETGLLSSHRTISLARHARSGSFGEATGKMLRYRVIADCAARDDMIFDEWLVRDQGSIVRQMGWEPKAYAADLIAREGGPDACARPFTPAADVAGRYRGKGNDDPTGQRYAELLTAIMAADFAIIPKAYDRAAQLEHPGGITGHGWVDADSFWIGLRAAFPNAAFELHHIIGRSDSDMPPRAALRWSLTGKHEGWGAFGGPSGANVHVMGLSHAEFGPYGLRREWVLFDQIAIWKQILLATG